jgi:hypothetical protein
MSITSTKGEGDGYRNTKGEENAYMSNARGGPGLFSQADLSLFVSSILLFFS